MKHLVPIIVMLSSFLFLRHASAAEQVGVIVVGDTEVQPQVAAQLETWLADHGHSVVKAALATERVTEVIACMTKNDEKCAVGVIERGTKASSIVYVSAVIASTRDGSRNLTLVGYWFEKQRDPIAERRVCESCTDATMRSATDELASALVKARFSSSGRLKLTSKPTGAKVVIDGAPIGVTPIEHDLAPGNHQVTVSADKHEMETRTVPIRAGETTMLDVPLVETRDDRPGGGSRPLLPAVVGLGGVLVMATGGVLVAIDEDMGPDEPRLIRDSAPLGVTLLAAGAVVTVVGAVWWLRSSKKSAPVVAVTRDTSFIGWTGSF